MKKVLVISLMLLCATSAHAQRFVGDTYRGGSISMEQAKRMYGGGSFDRTSRYRDRDDKSFRDRVRDARYVVRDIEDLTREAGRTIRNVGELTYAAKQLIPVNANIEVKNNSKTIVMKAYVGAKQNAQEFVIAPGDKHVFSFTKTALSTGAYPAIVVDGYENVDGEYSRVGTAQITVTPNDTRSTYSGRGLYVRELPHRSFAQSRVVLVDFDENAQGSEHLEEHRQPTPYKMGCGNWGRKQGLCQ